MRKKIKIQILLSTFNGERYLREQLDSYLDQLGDFDIKILIRDDGSTDSTINILKIYEDMPMFDIIYGKNLGLTNSMKILIDNCDITRDYFAISDQDDVWSKDKFLKAIKQLSKYNNEYLLLYSSRSYVTDENLNVIGETLFPKKGVSYYNAMVQNVCPGHTQVFNKEVIKILQKNYSNKIHVIDWWIYLLVSALGVVIFDDEKTVFHRQHKNNSVGYEVGFIKKNFRRILNFDKNKMNSISHQLLDFYNLHKEILEYSKKKETEMFFLYQKNFILRLKYIFRTPVYRHSIYENYLFKILYILNKYKL